MSRRYSGNVYFDRETSRTAYRVSSQSASTPAMYPQDRGSSLSAVSTCSSRASERRAMGIIDIDEDEDEENEEERSIDKEYPRLMDPPTHLRTPISETRQSTSNRISSHSQSPANHAAKRIVELEQRVQVAERKPEMEQKSREMTEREVRDLQSSLYAPIADGGRKRKERSGNDDDDLNAYLLQYAINESKAVEGDDDASDLENHMVQYAIKKSRDESLSKQVLKPPSGREARSSSTRRDLVHRSVSAATRSPSRILDQHNWSTPSAFAADFWSSLSPVNDHNSSRPGYIADSHPERNLVFRSAQGPKITILSVPRIKTFLGSGLQRPYNMRNLRTLAGWWSEDSLVGYGVKQKWLLAYSVQEWWRTFKLDTQFNTDLDYEVRSFIGRTWDSKRRDETRAKHCALAAHPGLRIEGQVYDMQ